MKNPLFTVRENRMDTFFYRQVQFYGVNLPEDTSYSWVALLVALVLIFFAYKDT
jgi:hypothetical protein